MKAEKIKRTYRNHKIKSRVFVSLIVFTLLLLGLLWFFQIKHYNVYYAMVKRHELKQAVRQLKDNWNIDNFEDYIYGLGETNNISINVVNSDCKTLYGTRIYPSNHIWIRNSGKYMSFYDKAKANGGSVIFEVAGMYEESHKYPRRDNSRNESYDLQDYIYGTIDDKNNGTTLIYAEILESEGFEDCLLLLSTLITPLDSMTNTLRLLYGGILLLFLVMAFGMAAVTSQWVAKPITALNEAAKELASGKFDVNFGSSGYREIKELSETLEYAAKQIGKSEQLQRELLANVSHDLRTPLTMIVGYAEMMRDIPGENSPENIQAIIDETNRLNNLVNELIDMSKLQAGVVNFEFANFDITESIIRVIDRFSKFTQGMGYEIEFEYTDNAIVYADEYKIYQVIYNMISNAINYSDKDKIVIVRQIIKEDVVRLEIEDHGYGIKEDEIDSIWYRYYKVDKMRQRTQPSTGLGLSIAHGILQGHNALFGVESEFGKGSKFWFELKLAKPE